jgi:predicted ATP-binding protein involved in virulence
MKITKIKWNHSILGNLELGFANGKTGQPFDTVILAGENGSEKTTVLETLSRFLTTGTLRGFEYIYYKR